MFKRSIFVGLICVSILVLLTILVNSCGQENKKNTPEKTDSNSYKKSEIIDDENISKIIPITNDSLTDIARFISGKIPEKSARLKKLAKDSTWKKYASFIDLQWKKFEHDRLVYMDTFALAELKSTSKNQNVFYPFSGPDLLHALTFFPTADTILMLALEPPGNLSIIQEKELIDSLPQYFASMRQSLHAILNWSFFITKKMFADLRQKELNGTIHLLLWFAIHRNYEVAEIKPATIDGDGKLYVASSIKDTVYKNHKTKGVYLSLVKDGHAVNVFYYSADIADWSIKTNKEINGLINSYQFNYSFVKSASYLLHSPNFSTVRELILKKSNLHLQDDSGTPYRFFSSRKDWSTKLFGSYIKPIPVFNLGPQEDLIKAYDSLEISKLKFGIGYKHKKEESTLMLFKRIVSSK